MNNDLFGEKFFETTPGPWTVESHLDTEGAYIVKEVRHEQQIWGPAGYDISNEEGDRRDLIVERRDANNVRLIQFAPKLFEALTKLLLFPNSGKEHAIEVMQSISPNWQTLVSNPMEMAAMNSRSQVAETILAEYCRVKGESLDSLETGIIDLMADLMHLARREGLAGFTLCRTAQVHFLLEFETEAYRAYHKSNTTTKGE